MVTALPPGPSSTILSTWHVGLHPFTFYKDCLEQYGDPFTITAFNGTVVCTGKPEGARQVFEADPDTFLPFGVEAAAPIIGEDSIFMLSGERHRRERKLLAPPFHGRRMKAYAGEMQAAALRRVASWQPGQRLSLQKELQHIALEIILRAVFGAREGDDLERYEKTVREAIDAVSPSFLFFKFLQHEFGGLSPWARFKKTSDALKALLAETITRRRAGDGAGEDILSLLVQATYDDGSSMTDTQIISEMITLMSAGHETTGVSMSWAFDHLCRDPDQLRRLQEELDALGPDPAPDTYEGRLPFLNAVIQETLRLHPVLSDVIRLLDRPFDLLGHTLPAGVAIAVVPWLTHRDPSIFEEPDAFKPERFIDRTWSPYEYIPFGGPPRRCIGSAFAQTEMRIVLGTLFSRCRFTLVDDEPAEPKRLNAVMGPESGIPVIYEGPRA